MRPLTSFSYVPTKQQLKDRCTTVKAWQLPKQKSALAPDHVWTNADMDPVPLENQTWTLWTWMAYWATDTIVRHFQRLGVGGVIGSLRLRYPTPGRAVLGTANAETSRILELGRPLLLFLLWD